MRRAYGRLSRIYAHLEGRFEVRQRRWLIEMLAVREGERVLEIGVGTGFALEALARRVGASGMVVGADITPEMLEQSARRVHRAGLRRQTRLVEGDGRELPFGPRSFDAVFMLSTLELFDTRDIPTVLDELANVLKPGGRIGIGSLSKEGRERLLSVRLYEWLNRKVPALAGCRPIYPERSIEAAGFRIAHHREMFAGGVLPVKLVVAFRQGGTK